MIKNLTKQLRKLLESTTANIDNNVWTLEVCKQS